MTGDCPALLKGAGGAVHEDNYNNVPIGVILYLLQELTPASLYINLRNSKHYTIAIFVYSSGQSKLYKLISKPT